MTATVKEFCRMNGLNENSENLIETIYEALTGGAADRITERVHDTGAQSKTAIPNRST